MASSVSSERSFSAGGITITKLRNRLRGDIVEAIQVIKLTYRDTVDFKEQGPSMATEVQIDKDNAEEEENMKDVKTQGDWVIELDDECYETEPTV
ncbi:hypothetical protein D9757_014746 [Collybiopsis confluens]|uniref:HAT C-terminal dimerisation domain-containing protein n=1 Tax=Collybiopsis confluens TaxID=2823264 RepID=A0A8H5D6G3_9AGAR|nr:hypothetical protein D9757_014746 [Collybiopsis confluens]